MAEIMGFDVGRIFDKDDQVFDLPVGCEELYTEEGLQNSRGEIGNTELSNLCLILDLDHTLLHSQPLHTLSLTEEEEAKYLNQEDVFRWELMGVEYLTKLRPFVRKFLEETNKLHIYTMGSFPYALQMTKLLDPETLYFGSRVTSRESCTIKGQKALDVVPVHQSVAVILDDTQSVWPRNLDNLIVIDKYNFFALRVPNKSDGISLSEQGMDESEVGGALSCALEVLKEVHSLFVEFHNYLDAKHLLKIVWEHSHEANTEPPSTRKRSRIEDEESTSQAARRRPKH